MWRAFGWILLSIGLSGCLAPPSPAQRVTDAARELNLAARFGRMDVALERTADGARDHFMRRRTHWGQDVRVVDFELAGLEMPDVDHATILVDVQWVRLTEGSLRATRVEQTYRNGDKGGYRLVRERRLSGDLGLFGEPTQHANAAPHGDVHFPSKTIR